MSRYFAEEKSLARAQQDSLAAELRTIASHYMGANPATPPVFRISLRDGFKRQADYRYRFDLSERFPDAEQEQAVYAWARIWFDEAGEACFSSSAVGPMTVYVNGEEIYHSNYEEERDPQRLRKSFVQVRAGWNHVVIEFLKTALGFGGVFGTGRFKNFPFHFIMPLADTEGWEGWVFTKPRSRLPDCQFAADPELAQQQEWLPDTEWPVVQQQSAWQRVFAGSDIRQASAWTRASLRKGQLHVYGQAEASVCLCIGSARLDLPAGRIDQVVPVDGGRQDILVTMGGQEGVKALKLEFEQAQQTVHLTNPAGVIGYEKPWLYLGTEDPVAIVPDLTLVQGGQYWQVDVPGGYIRPFLENARFGKWNYPLGVTLYGLLAASELLGPFQPAVQSYIRKHVECATRYYQYSLWDRQQYGAAGIDNQLSNIDSLDDCGSFASLMLELDRSVKVAGCRQVADDTADYIEHRQCRLPDGAFCRGKAGLAEMNGTMWADDLYMSVPFLCRYYELTGDSAIIDDAANQYRQFRKYLYMPEQQIMSHVYLTDRQLANHIPWGRGNGWVLFSLSELLRVLPETHKDRDWLLAFFQDLCQGYRKLQDEDGMWHQVLNDPTAYQEASCTAMFVSAFSRGIRHGWLTEDIDAYCEAVEKGWQGLMNIAADSSGNIYGICQGSGYSFRSTYYRDELTWVLNDPHGIGIVLMAGTECQKLREWIAD